MRTLIGGLLTGLLLLGFVFSEGRTNSIKPDDGMGPPHIGTCSGGHSCGMTLIIDNSKVWETQP